MPLANEKKGIPVAVVVTGVVVAVMGMEDEKGVSSSDDANNNDVVVATIIALHSYCFDTLQ